MNSLQRTAFLLTVLLISLLGQAQPIQFKLRQFELSIDAKGCFTRLANPQSGIDYLAKGINSPVLSIRISKQWYKPTTARWDNQKQQLQLDFNHAEAHVKVKITQKEAYLKFEVIEMQPNSIEAIVWGPVPTCISETICEVVGVARNNDYAIGIQALNTKTLGGILKNEEGSEDARGSVAVVRDYGSSLQAYSINRSLERTLDVWCEYFPHFPEMPVPPIQNETCIGSTIALFGCSPNEVLPCIEAIELGENLPHPMLDGKWIKQTRETGRPYMIADFNDRNIDSLLHYAQQAGMAALYHEGPFKTWGHYILDSNRFTNGNASMRMCVEKARSKGLRLGVHTLTTFITTNDPYVSPVPDKRLAVTGSAKLIEAVDDKTDILAVSSPEFFNNTKANSLHTFRIGNEIIRYKTVSETAPFLLSDCQRGAYGTKAVAHPKGTDVSMLMDYPYEVFFPNFDLQQEIAGNLAKFFNETGVSQMDFDGHEGCYSTGQGDYAMQAFADKVYRGTKHNLVNGTSRSSHYYWHLCHYWNWGEPWYGGFRESQGDYRIENQPLLERNYMPNMLGWFLLSATTTPEDIEWMMARAAGFNAGFALVARIEGLRKNPQTDKLLYLIKIWQEAYQNNLFTDAQRKRLKDPTTDFHLEKSEGGFNLYPFNKFEFEHSPKLLQPGQPTYSEWDFVNKDTDQALLFTITLMGEKGGISNPIIELDNYQRIELTGNFTAGSSLVCDGSSIKVYNAKGKFQQQIALSKDLPKLSNGSHKLKFDCKFADEDGPKLRILVKTMGKPEWVKANK